MKRIYCLIMLAALLLLAACRHVDSAEPAELVIAANGKSDMEAFVLPDPTGVQGVDRYVRMATEELSRIIKETTGTAIKVVREKELPDVKRAIFVGNTARFRALGGDVTAFKDVENRIFVKDGSLFLVGHDYNRQGEHWLDEPVNHNLATIRAIVRFAEQYAGAEFLMPGPNGTNINPKDKISVPENLDSTERPRLRMSAGRSTNLMYDYANTNYGFGDVFHYRGHSYYKAVPRSQYAQTHPEYYILAGGKRDPSVGHLCISNPEVQELIYKEALKRLDAGAQVVQLAQTDGYTPCECDNCKAYGNTDDPAEKLWILHRGMAERLKKDRPGKMLQIIAYAPTWEPPKTFDTFPGNVIIELCRYDEANFKAFSKLKGVVGYAVYLYDWGEYMLPGLLPKRTPEFIARQAKFFASQNVQCVYRCGHGELYGLEGPVYHVHAKMLENPELDVNALVQHYIDRTYLEAAGPMAKFYEQLHQRISAFSLLEGGVPGADVTTKVAALPQDPRVMVGYLFSPEMIRTLYMRLEAAERLAKSDKVKMRLALVRRELDYASSLATVVSMYDSYCLKHTQTLFDSLADAVEAHQKLVNSYYDSKGNMKKVPGWPDIQFLGNKPKSLVMSNGRMTGEIGAPLNWNIKFLREKKVLPGAQMCRLTVKKATEPVQFNDFTAAPWSSTEWNRLNHIQLGNLKEQTRFKVLYDADAIHFAIETELPDARKHKSMGHDGQPYLQDCLEILIDPLGTREVSYHFIFNPLENSWFESALGLISDPLHPMFGKEDAGWNGKWSYQTRRKDNRWYALVSIPFATFNQKTPSTGTFWTMNIARQSYHSPNMKWAGEIGLWSPNLENMFISKNLNTFGEAIFE